jgi:hypothetical protein
LELQFNVKVEPEATPAILKSQQTRMDLQVQHGTPAEQTRLTLHEFRVLAGVVLVAVHRARVAIRAVNAMQFTRVVGVAVDLAILQDKTIPTM